MTDLLAIRRSQRECHGTSRSQRQLAGHCLDVPGILGEDLQLTLVAPQPGLSIRKLADVKGSVLSLEARGLDVGRLLDVRRDARSLLDGGIADGRVELRANAEELRFHMDLRWRDARTGVLAQEAAEESQLGDPTNIAVRFDGVWRRAEKRSRSRRSTRRWPVRPCRARSRCTTSAAIRFWTSRSAFGIWNSPGSWVPPASRYPKASDCHLAAALILARSRSTCV